jgi:hypothetical protein
MKTDSTTEYYYLQLEYTPIPAAARSKAWVCGRALAGIVGSNPTGGMDVCLLWVFVLSGRGICDGPIPRSEESYRLWCVFECDQVKMNNHDTYCEQVGRRGKDYENELEYTTPTDCKSRSTCWTFRLLLGITALKFCPRPVYKAAMEMPGQLLKQPWPLPSKAFADHKSLVSPTFCNCTYGYGTMLWAKVNKPPARADRLCRTQQPIT